MKNNDKRTKKDQKTVLLILPVCILLLFVGLFTGAGISHSQLRKELIEMRDTGIKRNDDARLTVLEKRYNKLSRIIGRNSETEQLISDLQMKR
jgi:hypothetical protein